MLIGLLVLNNAQASYRLYKLKLEHLDERERIERVEFTYSTMDPDQYFYFHTGGEPNMRVTLIDTWYCPGDTSRKKYCKKPVAKNEKDGDIPYTRQPVIP